MPNNKPDSYYTDSFGNNCFFTIDSEKMDLSKALNHLIQGVGFSRAEAREYLRYLMAHHKSISVST
jgi:hypothetical protein